MPYTSSSDEMIWHQRFAVFPHRTVNDAWTAPLEKVWCRQRKDGKWEYQGVKPPEETFEDWLDTQI
ncbi:hypothetical protein IVB40_07670 [Bradyrhizobium sp. 40]|uniref:hypothetical protein n=1 Tax=Bradyrhizobium sp. 40 TaxID=2782674 RepID=UPI001FFFE14A|nr:hypothetical protein [Bradyrhizobium sp. 40]UPJ43938.1 hypothetical protein IVB40_07670 [Bradyrhizobium sp. 40]